MDLSWLESLLLGLVSGFTEILPVSAHTHRLLFLTFTGTQSRAEIMSLIGHIGALLAVLLCCAPQISRLRREKKIASKRSLRNKRQPNQEALMDLKFLRTASVPLILSFVISLALRESVSWLCFSAVTMMVNAILLYIPPYFPRSNKSSLAVSGLDGLLLGLSMALSGVPGVSSMAVGISVGQLRGLDREYLTDILLLLMIPVIALYILADLIAIIILGGVAITASLVISVILVLLTSFAGAYLGVQVIRFLAVKAGFSGFSGYCLGAALFTFILYLLI